MSPKKEIFTGPAGIWAETTNVFSLSWMGFASRMNAKERSTFLLSSGSDLKKSKSID
ncbi:hypothetical protein [Pseudorhodoplanes sp.]|uniref:hypothetical protein n=1 Tax=Pseudorhodoplanes sp. TaxID=1934341 RepID=UPI00391D51D9